MAKNVVEKKSIPVGRPRSEVARQSVLKATLDLLDHTTVKDLTIEAIAAEAGVGKATIYRWWKTKTALVMEAFIDVMLPSTPIPNMGSAADAMTRHVTLLIRQYRGKMGKIVAELLAEGRFDGEVSAEFRRLFFQRRRAAVKGLIERGIASGEFDQPADVDAAIDAIYGSIYFRLIFGHLPLDRSFAADLSRLGVMMLSPPR